MSYWCNSKFADVLRGTTKLDYGTDAEWNKWHITAKQQHPIRYWLAEVALDKLDDAVHYPVRAFDRFLYYLKYRFVRKSHALTARSLRGQYTTYGGKIFTCIFEEFANFIEIDCASQIREDLTLFERLPIIRRIIVIRDPVAGLEHCKWSAEVNQNDHGRAMLTAIELYKWWTLDYQKRKDPYEEWHAYQDQFRDDSINLYPMIKMDAEANRLRTAAIALQQRYIQEDNEALLKLLSIREHLWA